VTTRALDQPFRRNALGFRDDFAYQLTEQEFRNLISQIVISKSGAGGRLKLPWAFSEHCVAMLSSVYSACRLSCNFNSPLAIGTVNSASA
jgi:hypothetical protein